MFLQLQVISKYVLLKHLQNTLGASDSKDGNDCMAVQPDAALKNEAVLISATSTETGKNIAS